MQNSEPKRAIVSRFTIYIYQKINCSGELLEVEQAYLEGHDVRQLQHLNFQQTTDAYDT